MHALKRLCLLVACLASIKAQAQQLGVFREPTTGLTMRYPVELTVVDTAKAIEEGHVAAFGSMQNEAKEHQLAARCMKPLLLAELPKEASQGNATAHSSSATLLLFEFIPSKECKAGFKYKEDEAVAGGLAQAAMQVPGAIALSPPLWFDFGKEKVHISLSAYGLNNTSPDQPHALIAGAGMRYHGHTFGWIMSADRLNTFNDLTKTSLQFDDAKTYPLVPFNLNDQLRIPSNLVK